MAYSGEAGRGEDESSGGRVHPVAVELEHRVASQHEEELLVCGGVALVVLVDDQVARSTGRPCGNTERRDAEVVSDRPVVTAPVRKLVDLVQMRNRVTSHEPPSVVVGRHARPVPARSRAGAWSRCPSVTDRIGTESLGPP
jgi:hypothetical protein